MMIQRLFAAIAVLMAASSGGARADTTADLGDALGEKYGALVAWQLPESDRDAVKRCIGLAMATGIPEDAQALILDVLQNHNLTPEAKTAIADWIGGSAVHGSPRPPDPDDPSSFKDGKFTYADGTPLLDSDATNAQRMDANLHQLCPEHVGKIKSTVPRAPQ